MTYLEEAAAELRKARESNEKRGSRAELMHSGQVDEKDALLAEVNQRRMELAAAFTVLAEIEQRAVPEETP